MHAAYLSQVRPLIKNSTSEDGLLAFPTAFEIRFRGVGGLQSRINAANGFVGAKTEESVFVSRRRTYRPNAPLALMDLQGSANRWVLGSVNPASGLPLAAGGGQVHAT